MNYQAITDALITRLKTVTSLPTLQLENKVVTPKGQPFTRATQIYARPTQATVGIHGRNRHEGLLQVDIFVPVNSGTAAANALVDSVVAAFPRGLALPAADTILNIRMAYRETGGRNDNDAYHNVPVVVEWLAVI